jgi:hypothetical protein
MVLQETAEIVSTNNVEAIKRTITDYRVDGNP